MFAQTILEFTDYLNEAGYLVPPDAAARCIASFTDSDADCTDYTDVLGAMRFYFCKDRQQRQDISEHFSNFINAKKEEASAKEAERELDEAKNVLARQRQEHSRKQESLSGQIKALEKQAIEIENRVRNEWKPDPTKFSRTDIEFLETKRGWIDSIKMPAIEGLLSGREEDISYDEIRKAQKKLLQIAEEEMSSGNLSAMADLKKLFDLMQKVSQNKKQEKPRREAAVRSATAQTLEKIRELKAQKAQEEKEHNRLQRELNAKLSSLKKSSVIIKPKAILHRPEFTGGHNAVQTYGGNTGPCPPEAEKEFRMLSPEDKAVITRYIKDNILKFKTKLSRNINDPSAMRVDMEKTIQNACRTGGLPIDIIKGLRKPGKANLVLMLDVSGSCREASEMMLTFLYLLQEAFPRGCRAYAFVNSLYDITTLMETKNAEDAIRETLGAIPRAGQYSNYEKPITSLWQDHGTTITKDSIVIMIGDARNNKNDSAENEFRNIARRAKRTYWLNTDVSEKWGQGDSIAPTYAKYCRMYETRTPKDIVRFLDTGMR